MHVISVLIHVMWHILLPLVSCDISLFRFLSFLSCFGYFLLLLLKTRVLKAYFPLYTIVLLGLVIIVLCLSTYFSFLCGSMSAVRLLLLSYNNLGNKKTCTLMCCYLKYYLNSTLKLRTSEHNFSIEVTFFMMNTTFQKVVYC